MAMTFMIHCIVNETFDKQVVLEIVRCLLASSFESYYKYGIVTNEKIDCFLNEEWQDDISISFDIY